jgi:hypothetical protein
MKNLKNLILTTICLFSFMANASLVLKYQDTNSHILKLREQRTNLTINEKPSWQEAELARDTLRSFENYGQSLAEYFIDSFENDTLQPYTLNLLTEYFQTQIVIHKKILATSTQSDPALILQVLQLESFKKVHDLFFHKQSLRTIIKDQLATTSYELSEWVKIKEVTLDNRRVTKLMNKVKQRLMPVAKFKKSNLSTMVNDFENTVGHKLLLKDQNWDTLTNTNLFWKNIGDNLRDGVGAVATGASSAFGAVAGSIAWREGYLKDNKTLLENLNNTLQPFDLLMEKKAYKFTDLTIPGHWGHIGVYLGSEAQLKELGLWDSPQIEPFKENIRQGKRIFQVRRWGLVFDDLEEFINLDEMAILRVEGFAKRIKEDQLYTIEYLSDQLGKGYDFSFDAMTGETVTCTEIIAFSYGPITWPMEQILGRLTITPNNLAELAFYHNSPLKTVAYITGDQAGMHIRTEEELGATLQYKAFSDGFYKYSEECEREAYRHRRQGIRFRYSCEDKFEKNIYQ